MPLNLPVGVDVVGGYKSPESVAKTMLARQELLNSKTKLTWDDNDEPIYSTHKMTGLVNESAPYIKFGTYDKGKYYWLQNNTWFLGNGSKTTLEEVVNREAAHPDLIAAFYSADEIFRKEAAKRDPNICVHCLKFRAKGNDEYVRHMWDVHPDKLAQITKPEESVPAAKPVEQVTVSPEPEFECCGKSFKDIRGLLAHKRFSKTNHGA